MGMAVLPDERTGPEHHHRRRKRPLGLGRRRHGGRCRRAHRPICVARRGTFRHDTRGRARHVATLFPKPGLYRRHHGTIQHVGQFRLAPHQPALHRLVGYDVWQPVYLRTSLRFLHYPARGAAFHQHEIARHEPYLPFVRQQDERRRPHTRLFCRERRQTPGHGLQARLSVRPRLLCQPIDGPLRRHALRLLPRRTLQAPHSLLCQPPENCGKRRHRRRQIRYGAGSPLHTLRNARHAHAPHKNMEPAER